MAAAGSTSLNNAGVCIVNCANGRVTTAYFYLDTAFTVSQMAVSKWDERIGFQRTFERVQTFRRPLEALKSSTIGRLRMTAQQ